ncbi:MAG TPA: CapA family protein [Spirochaetota bacterium]|nr:CapA family protein [Spirochaetota bacterium]HRV15015.1 CapA family protein [Spirochaetota bacterium]
MRLISIAIPIIFIFVISCFNTVESKNNNTGLTVSFTGDVIMHGPVKSFAFRNNIIDIKTKRTINNGGFDILFEHIKPEFENSDYVVTNMEFPVAPPFTSKPFIFNCTPAVLDAFVSNHINIVTLANNHILDQQYEGLLSTIKILESKNINYIGAGTLINTTKDSINGIVVGDSIKIGIIAYTGVFNYELSRKLKKDIYINDFYSINKVLNDIARIKQKCDFLVMVAHIGEEYKTQPAKKDRDIIHTYCEAGVDCVIGHHPHVIQPVEQFKTNDGRFCTIFYSLGNFIANQSSVHIDAISGVECSTRETIIVQLTVTKNTENNHHYTVIPVMIINIPDTESKYKYGKRIQPIAIMQYINLLKKENNNSEYINYLINRKNELIKHLFLYDNYQNIKIKDNY